MKTVDSLETIAASELKVCRSKHRELKVCRSKHLIEFMKVCEY